MRRRRKEVLIGRRERRVASGVELKSCIVEREFIDCKPLEGLRSPIKWRNQRIEKSINTSIEWSVGTLMKNEVGVDCGRETFSLAPAIGWEDLSESLAWLVELIFDAERRATAN
jgi:hypothetical protein